MNGENSQYDFQSNESFDKENENGKLSEENDLEDKCENSKKLFMSTKTRKMNNWTAIEDAVLLETAAKYNFKNWSAIAAELKNRTAIQCSARYKRIKPGIVKGAWTQEEDDHLIALIQKFGKNWSLISKYMPSRSGKQIRDRFLNTLDPTLNREKFSEEEDQKIIDLFNKYGTAWSKISGFFDRRTGDMIKNRFYSSLKKKLGEDEYLKVKLNAKSNQSILANDSVDDHPKRTYNKDNNLDVLINLINNPEDGKSIKCNEENSILSKKRKYSSSCEDEVLKPQAKSIENSSCNPIQSKEVESREKEKRQNSKFIVDNKKLILKNELDNIYYDTMSIRSNGKDDIESLKRNLIYNLQVCINADMDNSNGIRSNRIEHLMQKNECLDNKENLNLLEVDNSMQVLLNELINDKDKSSKKEYLGNQLKILFKMLNNTYIKLDYYKSDSNIGDKRLNSMPENEFLFGKVPNKILAPEIDNFDLNRELEQDGNFSYNQIMNKIVDKNEMDEIPQNLMNTTPLKRNDSNWSQNTHDIDFKTNIKSLDLDKSDQNKH